MDVTITRARQIPITCTKGVVVATSVGVAMGEGLFLRRLTCCARLPAGTERSRWNSPILRSHPEIFQYPLRARVTWIQFHGGFHLLERFGETPRSSEDLCEVVAEIRIVGLEPDGFAELADCLVGFALLS